MGARPVLEPPVPAAATIPKTSDSDCRVCIASVLRSSPGMLPPSKDGRKAAFDRDSERRISEGLAERTVNVLSTT
jgi:hypothetical protein